jgi:septum site-determining protein MinD
MKTLAFTVSKGGVGKSLITANVGASLAKKGKKVILVEGDPNHPLQLILNVELDSTGTTLDEVVKKDMETNGAIHRTGLANLYMIPSGVSLQNYFDLEPIRFARKIRDLDADFVFIDTPFPLGKAALLSLGVSEYFITILTEDEFVLCVESAIDTIRLGKYYLKCIPIGFVLNRIKTSDRFTKEFVKDLENLLEIPCLARIEEDPKISKSYGGTTSQKAFLAYERYPESEFGQKMDEIADYLLGELPKADKKDAVRFLQELIQSAK